MEYDRYDIHLFALACMESLKMKRALAKDAGVAGEGEVEEGEGEASCARRATGEERQKLFALQRLSSLILIFNPICLSSFITWDGLFFLRYPGIVSSVVLFRVNNIA